MQKSYLDKHELSHHHRFILNNHYKQMLKKHILDKLIT